MNISTLIAIVCAGIVFLILFLVIFVLIHQRKMMESDAKFREKEVNYNKQLLNATLEIAEEERGKIARNVHDDLGMMLHALKSNITKVKRNLGDKNIAGEALQNSEQIIDETISTVRIISSDLLPGPLINIGFLEGISYLCDQINTSKLIKIEELTELENLQMEQKNAIHLFRLVKEILNNIIKHAKATEASLKISVHSSFLNISIKHNGVGITNDTVRNLTESSKGIGLRSIMGRGQLLGATIQYFVVNSEISEVKIEVPLN